MIKTLNNYYTIIACLIFYILTLSFSWHLELYTEDIWHMNAASWKEAWDVAVQSYNNNNARIGEALIYFLGVSSEGIGSYHLLWLHRFINPAFITACALFIYRAGTGTWPKNNKKSLITLLFIFFCILCNKTGFYWPCSNTNWFYPTVISLLFFIATENFFYGKHLKTLNFIIALCSAPIIGMSNETVSFVSLIMYVAAGFIYFRKNKEKKYTQYIVIGIILLTFAILFYTAPGPYQRVAEAHTSMSKIEFAIRNTFSANWLHVLFWCWRLIFIAGIVAILIPLKYWKPARTITLLCAAIMLGGILMLAPSFGAPRSFIPVEIVLMAVLSGAIYRAHHGNALNNQKTGFVFLSLIGLSITIMIPNTVRSIDRARLFSSIQEKADMEKSAGGDTLVLEEKDLHHASVWAFKIKIPRSLIEIYPLYSACKPFQTTTREDFENSVFVHKYAQLPYEKGFDFGGTDLSLNKGMARYFGLKAIIVLRDEAPKEETNTKQ